MACENEDPRSRLLIDFLNKRRESIWPWIHRKEVAAWTAVAFYLTGLIIFFNFMYENLHPKDYWDLIFFIPIVIGWGVFFGVFIHAQFGCIAHEMQVQRAIDVWILEFIKAGKIPEQFKFIYNRDQVLPRPIHVLLEMQNREKLWKGKSNQVEKKLDNFKRNNREFLPNRKTDLKPIRQLWWFYRIFLPISVIFKKSHREKYTFMERQEGTLYLIMAFVNIGIIVKYLIKLLDC